MKKIKLLSLSIICSAAAVAAPLLSLSSCSKSPDPAPTPTPSPEPTDFTVNLAGSFSSSVDLKNNQAHKNQAFSSKLESKDSKKTILTIVSVIIDGKSSSNYTFEKNTLTIKAEYVTGNIIITPMLEEPHPEPTDFTALVAGKDSNYVQLGSSEAHKGQTYISTIKSIDQIKTKVEVESVVVANQPCSSWKFENETLTIEGTAVIGNIIITPRIYAPAPEPEPEVKLSLWGGITDINGEINKKEIDDHFWKVYYNENEIAASLGVVPIDEATKLPSELKISSQGQLSWTNIQPSTYKFKIKALATIEQKKLVGYSPVIKLIVNAKRELVFSTESEHLQLKGENKQFNRVVNDWKVSFEGIDISKKVTWSLKKTEASPDFRDLILIDEEQIGWSNALAVNNYSFNVCATYTEPESGFTYSATSTKVVKLTIQEARSYTISGPLSLEGEEGFAESSSENWTATLGDNPVTPYYSLVDEDNKELENGITIDDNGKISWTKDMKEGSYSFYVVSKYSEPSTLYNYSTKSNKITLTINKHRSFTFSNPASTILSGEHGFAENDVKAWSTSLNGKAILSKDVELSLVDCQKEGSKTLDTQNIKISNGVVNWTKDVEDGKYVFKVHAKYVDKSPIAKVYETDSQEITLTIHKTKTLNLSCQDVIKGKVGTKVKSQKISARLIDPEYEGIINNVDNNVEYSLGEIPSELSNLVTINQKDGSITCEDSIPQGNWQIQVIGKYKSESNGQYTYIGTCNYTLSLTNDNALTLSDGIIETSVKSSVASGSLPQWHAYYNGEDVTQNNNTTWELVPVSPDIFDPALSIEKGRVIWSKNIDFTLSHTFAVKVSYKNPETNDTISTSTFKNVVINFAHSNTLSIVGEASFTTSCYDYGSYKYNVSFNDKILSNTDNQEWSLSTEDGYFNISRKDGVLSWWGLEIGTHHFTIDVTCEINGNVYTAALPINITVKNFVKNKLKIEKTNIDSDESFQQGVIVSKYKAFYNDEDVTNTVTWNAFTNPIHTPLLYGEESGISCKNGRVLWHQKYPSGQHHIRVGCFFKVPDYELPLYITTGQNISFDVYEPGSSENKFDIEIDKTLISGQPGVDGTEAINLTPTIIDDKGQKVEAKGILDLSLAQNFGNNSISIDRNTGKISWYANTVEGVYPLSILCKFTAIDEKGEKTGDEYYLSKDLTLLLQNVPCEYISTVQNEEIETVIGGSTKNQVNFSKINGEPLPSGTLNVKVIDCKTNEESKIFTYDDTNKLIKWDDGSVISDTYNLKLSIEFTDEATGKVSNFNSNIFTLTTKFADFSTDSWTNLAKSANFEMLKERYGIDYFTNLEKTLDVDGISHKVRVAAEGVDQIAGTNKYAPLTFEFGNLLCVNDGSEKIKKSIWTSSADTNFNSWSKSDVRKYLKDDLLNHIPDLNVTGLNVVKTVLKKTNDGTQDNGQGKIEINEEKFFLPSLANMFSQKAMDELWVDSKTKQGPRDYKEILKQEDIQYSHYKNLLWDETAQKDETPNAYNAACYNKLYEYSAIDGTTFNNYFFRTPYLGEQSSARQFVFYICKQSNVLNIFGYDVTKSTTGLALLPIFCI